MTGAAPRRILAVIGDEDAQPALQAAAALADRHGASLSVMGCLEPPHDIAIAARLAGRDPDAVIRDAAARLRDALTARVAADLPGVARPPHVAIGKPFLEIVRHVAENGFDCVVKTAEPLSGLGRFLFSSIDQHLLRKCPCPVWLQTARSPPVPRTVIAAVDLDLGDAAEPGTLVRLNARVLDTARAVAGTGSVTVLHAWDAPAEGMVWAFAGSENARLVSDSYVNAILDDRRAAMHRLLVAQGCLDTAVPRLVRGLPERIIPTEAAQCGADVIVMGTVARTGLSGVFIGNTAENIINSLDRAVIAVKPDGFISPLARP